MKPQFESILPDRDSSFHVAHFGCDSFAADHTWHYHPEYEITWIVRSGGTRFVGDSIEPYRADDLALIGPELPHCWHNDPADGDAHRPELFLVQFCESFLGEGFFSLPESRTVRDLLREAAGGLLFPAEVARTVAPLVRRLGQAQGIQRVISLLDLLDRLSRSERRPLASLDYQAANDVNPVSRARVETVHRYVRENIGNEITQAEIAGALGMSAPAFSKFFRAATGHTFVNFVNILRVNEACRMLSRGEAHITCVAMDCGYNNLSNFNRQFLQLKGVTPSEYRRGAAVLGRDRQRLSDMPGPDDPATRFRPREDALPKEAVTQSR